jgi:hypothetical protein
MAATFNEYHIPGTQLVIWGEPGGAGEVFIFPSIDSGRAFWNLWGNSRPGACVVVAPDHDELKLLTARYRERN